MREHISGTLCAFVVCGLSAIAVAQGNSNTAQRIGVLQQQVLKDIQEQKPQLAIPALREIISLDPNNLNANANLGVLLFFQEEYVDAIPPMRTALQLKPDLWKIEALLGIAEKRTGDPDNAEKDLEKAFPYLQDIKIKKEAGLELVELESSSGQLSQALVVTEKLVELLPGDAQVLFVAYEISEQVTYKTLLNMMVVSPDSAEMHMMMAGELARRGDHANAIAQYRNAIRLNPNLPGAHYELGEQLRASSDPALNAQAEEQYKAALQVNQYDVKAWCRLGESVAAKGDYKSAQEDYRKALAIQPRYSDAETDLAIAYISMNQTGEAISLLESAEKDDPTNIVAHYRLSLLYRRAGRMQDSEREMKLFFHYRDIKDKLGDIFKQMAKGPGPR
ncbi:MAG TPA: tetratricopeptide repeat protein [Terracidiphilus sp.]|nr:tetratricopeptide repeat protein [Terracidiphilus sp.]